MRRLPFGALPGMEMLGFISLHVSPLPSKPRYRALSTFSSNGTAGTYGRRAHCHCESPRRNRLKIESKYRCELSENNAPVSFPAHSTICEASNFQAQPIYIWVERSLRCDDILVCVPQIVALSSPSMCTETGKRPSVIGYLGSSDALPGAALLHSRSYVGLSPGSTDCFHDI